MPTAQDKTQAEGFEAAKKKALTLLKMRDRSETELEQRLERAGFETDDITQVLEFCRRCGFLDDERFASSFIRGKLGLGWGEQRIARGLKAHGIDLFELDGYPELYTITSEKDRALELLRRHSLPQKNPKQKLYRYLLSKGFATQTAYEAVNCYLQELETCN